MEELRVFAHMCGFSGCAPPRPAPLTWRWRVCAAPREPPSPGPSPLTSFWQLGMGGGGDPQAGRGRLWGGIPSPSSRAGHRLPFGKAGWPMKSPKTLGQQVRVAPGVSAPAWGGGGVQFCLWTATLFPTAMR